jgi:DNA-binding NtrC family response regulator
MTRILVVDDEPNLREAIQMVLTAASHTVDVVGSGETAVEAHRRAPYDALVLDIALPGMNGVETLAAIKVLTPEVVAIFITAHGSIASAVEAMRTGGFDYLPKPFDNDELVLKVERALAHRRLTNRVQELEEQLEARTAFADIVGRSAAIQTTVGRLSRVAGSDVSVLLSGETGTGKELAALTVHRRSPRASGPFVPVNCGAVPPTLAESEFFGHERGAFTDAKNDRRGLFERAHRGTLFLDEIGDLSADLQVKLVRVLQEKEITRVGGSRSVAVDVRIVAASHKKLETEVREGRFREDLFWRLNVFTIEMPPLRDRLDDIPLLIEHLLKPVNAECRSRIVGVDPCVRDRLCTHSWPGNVRELLSVLKHGAVMSVGATIGLADLPAYLLEPTPTSPPREGEAVGATTPGTLKAAIAETERRLIQAVLRRFEGNSEAAAAALGISRRKLFYKLKVHRAGLSEVGEAKPTD